MPVPALKTTPLLVATATITVGLAAACSSPPPAETPCKEPKAQVGLVACPPGTQVEGDKCIRNDVLTVVSCPSGSHYESGACRGNINTDCPDGMLFKSGTGCVPVIAVMDPAPSAPVGLIPSGSKCPSGMAFVRGGAFTLGGFHASAGSTVSVKDFCIDLTEVTVGAYKVCSKKGTCPTSKLVCNQGSSSWVAGDDQLPLNCIDYNDSSTYCSFAGKRMVTEDEWEWVARGGTLARKYPWGNNDDWSRLCASTPNKRTLPCRVGSFSAGDTPLGVHDMAGSLWEWTRTTRAKDNLSPTHMAIRGGGWDIVVGFPSFAAGSRVGYEPTYRSKAVGFRCAKSP
ncbi:MAG: SUMF1/EgtB/PvdO family nonheme iron enzyme [Polyangiaceae bacterium]